jgi:hypothetical protein
MEGSREKIDLEGVWLDKYENDNGQNKVFKSRVEDF